MSDLHFVISARRQDDGSIGYRVEAPPSTWEDAIGRWQRLDDARLEALGHGWTPRADYYMVRSVKDPQWSPLLHGFADKQFRSKIDGRWCYEHGTGRTKAARHLATLHGYHGKVGGWIYTRTGKVVCQGWDSFGFTMARRNAIRQGADNLWYVVGDWYPLVTL